MYNYQDDLSTLHSLGIKGDPSRGPSIQVLWNFPPFGWIKVNIDGSARWAPERS